MPVLLTSICYDMIRSIFAGNSPLSSTGFQPVSDKRVNMMSDKINNTITEFKSRRRNLPHWEEPGNLYMVTFRAANHFKLPERARDIVFNSVLFHDGKKYDLYALVVMPDHIHLILQPLQKSKDGFYSLAEIMHSIKSYSANAINKLLKRSGHLWQNENFDRLLRSEDEIYEKVDYIVNNPLKSKLADKPDEYKWCFIRSKEW